MNCCWASEAVSGIHDCSNIYTPTNHSNNSYHNKINKLIIAIRSYNTITVTLCSSTRSWNMFTNNDHWTEKVHCLTIYRALDLQKPSTIYSLPNLHWQFGIVVYLIYDRPDIHVRMGDCQCTGKPSRYTLCHKKRTLTLSIVTWRRITRF